jgi:hypothetical protein
MAKLNRPKHEDTVEEKKPKKITKMQQLSPRKVEEAIVAERGLLSNVAKRLNISYQLLTKFIKENPKVKDALERADDANLDFAESKLRDLIDAKNVTAIIFYLKTKGKKRGYIENATDLNLPTKPILFKYVPATPEEIKKVAAQTQDQE